MSKACSLHRLLFVYIDYRFIHVLYDYGQSKQEGMQICVSSAIFFYTRLFQDMTNWPLDQGR